MQRCHDQKTPDQKDGREFQQGHTDLSVDLVVVHKRLPQRYAASRHPDAGGVYVSLLDGVGEYDLLPIGECVSVRAQVLLRP